MAPVFQWSTIAEEVIERRYCPKRPISMALRFLSRLTGEYSACVHGAMKHDSIPFIANEPISQTSAVTGKACVCCDSITIPKLSAIPGQLTIEPSVDHCVSTANQTVSLLREYPPTKPTYSPVCGDEELTVSTEGRANSLSTLNASVHSSRSTMVAQLNVIRGSSPRNNCVWGISIDISHTK